MVSLFEAFMFMKESSNIIFEPFGRFKLYVTSYLPIPSRSRDWEVGLEP